MSDDSQGCDPATVGAVIAAVVARYVLRRHSFVIYQIPVFDPAFFIFASQQLDHPAVHRGRRCICVRPAGQPPSSACCHGATGSTRYAEQRGRPVPLHSSLPGCQSVGEQAAAPVLLSAAGRKSSCSVLQHRTALQRILLCKGHYHFLCF